MALKIKDILFVIIIVVMAFFIFDGCEANRRAVEQNTELLGYTDSISYYKSKSGELVASNKALVISSTEQVCGLKAKLKELRLKKPRTVIKYKTITEIKEVKIGIDIPCEDFERDITIDSAYYTIDVKLTQDNLFFKSIQVPNIQDIYVADLRTKWWKKKELSVVVTNSNPIVTSIGLTSYTIEPNKEFYKKRWFWFALGVTGGVILTNKIR